ncbi:cyclic nucleotide-binding domain-containing protein [uncultured Mucilaginibacter sp.]|uniref:Crp/Fnr family transcriptional regulator n=1 Tax=uncultured Mucilaginibacter sp. TaxID=797541 RepID=UPI0025E6F924|nr:cyclic nucleotide-binding domain-containing protein [uncultured Mucilaginibacter sp.]
MIDSTAFIQRLNRTRNLPVKACTALTEGFRYNRFEAQETFLSPGNYASSIYYIQSGLVRGAIEGRNEKITTWFKQDGELIIPQGLFNQQASEEYINAIAKTSVISVSFRHILKVMESNHELNELMLLLLNEALMTGHYREKLLRIPAARDRYDYVAEHENFVLKRIPHYLVASYLNVTKETFSRLHKGLAY